jgi:UDPglucose 6-dehydrogenase
VRIAVAGLWHLGSVTAACLAAAGHEVRGWDPDGGVVDRLSAGEPPVSEPGLAELTRGQLETGRLRFCRGPADAVEGVDVLWITFDTPVDAEDRVDVDAVLHDIGLILPAIPDGALVVVSSQWPVGTTRRVERQFRSLRGEAARVDFAYSPENLRLGNALAVFQHPDRVVVGVRSTPARTRATDLLAPITDRLEFMSVESAEMTKHAINAFLAVSVTFINEIAGLCEEVGADAREVERGLKTERRIGPAAYLSPGGAFAGGTLARDVETLRAIGDRVGRDTFLCDGITASNRQHAGWAVRRLVRRLGALEGRRIAVWGLTYKPGTDTLRRSSSVELCLALALSGADVHAHDPAVRTLPADLADRVTLHSDPIDAARAADALIVATEWPAYRQVPADALAAAMSIGCVIDANRFLGATLGADVRFQLIAVGQPG